MDQTEIIQIIKAICDISSANGSGLNKVDMARKLLDYANVPQNAEIQKIPVSENKQVRILFFVPGDDDYYSLFAGIGTDGYFYFELSGIGILKEKGLELYDEEKVLPADYFVSVKWKLNIVKAQQSILIPWIDLQNRELKQELRG